MHVVGLEQLLVPIWNAWVLRGGRPEAQPLADGEGWLLTLNGRAKLGGWLFLLMFGGGLTGVLALQAAAPQPPREFWLLLIGFSVFTLMGVYYLIFCCWYRVLLTEGELVLRRFLIPTRRIRWHEIVAFRCDDETLNFESETHARFAIYLSLNGLSAIRRCLAAFASLGKTADSWATADQALLQRAPAWRCDEKDLEDDPFAPLGSWQQTVYEGINQQKERTSRRER